MARENLRAMMAGRLASGLMVAAPRSGSGKTVITIGLQRALARTGLVVRVVPKAGPIISIRLFTRRQPDHRPSISTASQCRTT